MPNQEIGGLQLDDAINESEDRAARGEAKRLRCRGHQEHELGPGQMSTTDGMSEAK